MSIRPAGSFGLCAALLVQMDRGRAPRLNRASRQNLAILSAWCCALLLAAPVFGQNAATSIPGLGPTGPVKKLFGDFKFTEGPAGDPADNVFFSDVPESKIYKVDSSGKLSVFLDPSHNSNGLMLSSSGDVVACQMEGRVVAISPDGKRVRVLADQYGGQRFNAPNDLVIDRQQGVYFTDPRFRAPQPLPQKVEGVYYVPAGGKPVRLVDNVAAPNGVILSPDERTLYLIPSMQAEMLAYPVTAPGKLGPAAVFCSVEQPPGQQGKGGDGCTVDIQGNLYVATGLGVQVFSPQGKPLGVIQVPEQPSNVTFAGPGNRQLYITARTSLYTAPMQVAGHVFGH